MRSPLPSLKRPELCWLFVEPSMDSETASRVRLVVSRSFPCPVNGMTPPTYHCIMRRAEKITLTGSASEMNGESLVEAMIIRINDQTFSANLPSPSAPGHAGPADTPRVGIGAAVSNVFGAELMVRIAVGHRAEQECLYRDQDYALSACPEHGRLGTQMGPNKNGKKW